MKKTNFEAVIEDVFSLTNGDCILAVEVISGELQVNNTVTYMYQEVAPFDVVITGAEQPSGQMQIIKANNEGKYGSHYGIKVEGHNKDEFQKGGKLLKIESPVDVNTPLTNPKLKKLMGFMQKEQTSESKDAMLHEVIMHAYFLMVILLEGEQDTQSSILPKGTKMQISLITNTENQQYYPIFTDWDEIRKWKAEDNLQTWIVDFDDFVSLVLNNDDVEGIVINPYTENIVLNTEMLFYLKQQKELQIRGVSKQVINKEEKVLLGEPKLYPKEMVEAVKKHMKTNKNIKEAWLRLMVRNNEQSYLMIVDFDGDKQGVFPGIGASAKPYLGGMYLELIPRNSDFGKQASNKCSSFYKKKKGLFNW
ncbi:MAG: enhanced serine sensitivity protein SseB [Coprobacillaceae bacterium]